MKLFSLLPGLAVLVFTSLALADSPPPGVTPQGGSCSMAAGPTTLAGLMLVVGAAALFMHRRRKD